MIIVKLVGGMGNQLFQYALGRRLSLTHGVPLVLDITALNALNPGTTKREYTLDAFDTHASVIRSKTHRLWTLLRERPEFIREKSSDTFDASILKTPNNNIYLSGYWLSPQYFEDIRETLLTDLRLRNPLSAQTEKILADIETSESVAIHVRRGDNVYNPSSAAFHGALTREDYEAAMLFFANKVPNPHFFIFSDDPAWCRQHIRSAHPLTFVEGNTEYPHEDLHLMRSCKHQALANSTLSWWAAWLNKNPNKVVLRPPFFTKGAFKTDDLFPTSWYQRPD